LASNTIVEKRRKLGQYSTPSSIAEFMAAWAIRSPNDLILDPCIGQGSLLIQCMKRLEEFGLPKAEAHAHIFGADVDAQAIASTLRNGIHGNFIVGDFLRIESKRKADRNNRTNIPPVDAILCNPPYTRHQLLPASHKARIASLVSEEVGIEINRRAGLHVYFLLHSTQFLREKGRLVFLVPSLVLEARYAGAVRDFIARKYAISSIVLFDHKSRIFPDANVSPCLVLIEKAKPNENTVTLVWVKSWPGTKAILEAITRGSLLDRETWGRIIQVLQTDLIGEAKWSKYFADNPTEKDASHKKHLVRLGSIAKVMRGIATGGNDIFTLTESQVKKIGVERRFLRPVITRTAYVKCRRISKQDLDHMKKADLKVWLLYCHQPKNDLKGTRALSYMQRAEREGYHRRTLARARHPWYKLESRKPAPILFTYMTRERPRFIYNEARALNLNNMHGIYPAPEISTTRNTLLALVSNLNSNFVVGQLRLLGRTYAGGLLKVEPKELEEVLVPKP